MTVQGKRTLKTSCLGKLLLPNKSGGVARARLARAECSVQ